MSYASIEVLLIEDDLSNLQLLRSALTQQQDTTFNITTTPQLAEAILFLRQSAYDIILLDLELADSSGIQTLVDLLHYAPLTPIVVLTDQDDDALGVQALQSGAQDYLVKQHSSDHRLIRAIRYAIERKRIEIDNIRLYHLAQAEIAERQRAEATLRASEERFAKAFRASPVALAIMRLRDGAITDSNESHERLLGYSHEELIGHTALELGILTDVERENFINLLRTGRMLHNHEAIFISKSGRPCHVLCSMERLEFAGEAHILINIYDITERKLAEQQIAYQAGVLAQVSDAIISVDTDFTIMSWNAAATDLYGWSEHEVIGKEMAQILPTDYLGADAIQIQETLFQQGRWQGEVSQPHRDGTMRSIMSSVRLLKDSTGTVTGAVGINRDITERKRAEREVQRLNAELEQRVANRTAELTIANKELESFSYSISHDLRAPLRAINGFLHILVEDYTAQLPDEAQQYIQVVCRNAQQMSRLIDDLLSFSQFSRQQLQKQPVAQSEIVRQTFADLSGEQANRQVAITIAELPLCQGDPALLKQVWINLIANALKYTRKRERSEIEVSCDTAHGTPIYSIRDNGVGFDMRYSQNLFGVFQRMHRADEYEGTGVGLAIVQQIVRRHGGRIWAEAAVDQGATFFFTLAAERPDPPQS